jgi:hypothetical protein
MKTLSLRLTLAAAFLIAVAAPVVLAQSEAPAAQPVTVRKLKDVILEGIAECKSAAPVGDRAALRTCLKGKSQGAVAVEAGGRRHQSRSVTDTVASAYRKRNWGV